MKDENQDMDDGAPRQDITRRFMWTLTRILKTGGVSKQGGVRMPGGARQQIVNILGIT